MSGNPDNLVTLEVSTSSDFLIKLKSLLDKGNVSEALALCENKATAGLFMRSSWDLIPLFANYTTDKNFSKNKPVFECCKILLLKIAKIAQPEEAILEFLEQAETRESSRFLVMLEAMALCLDRLENNKENSVIWCFNAILKHTSEIPAPQDFKLEKEEKVLLECDESVINITNTYEEIICFYKRYWGELKNKMFLLSKDESAFFKDCTVRFLLQLLGKPLIYCSMTTVSRSRQIAETIVLDITTFNYDLLYYLEFAHANPIKIYHANSDLSDHDFDNVCLGLLYYLIFLENVGTDYVNYVSNPVYVFERTLISVAELLTIHHSLVHYKGLSLAKFLLNKCPSKSFSFQIINSKVHSSFAKSLGNIMVFSEIAEIRKLALDVFQNYLYSFDPNGRYQLLFKIQDVISHPGFVGFIATQVKELINTSMNSLDLNEALYFQGKCMGDMLLKLCTLKDGYQSDLIEASDHIISCLNLIRFLIIRDPENLTGLWEFIPPLQRAFLEPVKEGLEITRAHYNLQLSDFEKLKKVEHVSVSIGGAMLPEMPVDEKKRVLNVALNTLDLIESLLSRVNECIELKR